MSDISTSETGIKAPPRPMDKILTPTDVNNLYYDFFLNARVPAHSDYGVEVPEVHFDAWYALGATLIAPDKASEIRGNERLWESAKKQLAESRQDIDEVGVDNYHNTLVKIKETFPERFDSLEATTPELLTQLQADVKDAQTEDPDSLAYRLYLLKSLFPDQVSKKDLDRYWESVDKNKIVELGSDIMRESKDYTDPDEFDNKWITKGSDLENLASVMSVFGNRVSELSIVTPEMIEKLDSSFKRTLEVGTEENAQWVYAGNFAANYLTIVKGYTINDQGLLAPASTDQSK